MTPEQLTSLRAADDFIRAALPEVARRIHNEFEVVDFRPPPGSNLDQTGLIDGDVIVAEYLDHNEVGLALDHLFYMVKEPPLLISVTALGLLASAAGEIDVALGDSLGQNIQASDLVFPPPPILFRMTDEIQDIRPVMKRIAEAKSKGLSAQRFNFNTFEIMVDCESSEALVADVLQLDDEALLSLDDAIRPGMFVRSITARSLAHIKRTFPEGWSDVVVYLSFLPLWTERVVAAAIEQSRGRLDRLISGVELGRLDWRDLLVNGQLASTDWQVQLDRLLGGGTNAGGA